uniref:Molybdopterin biosynthesis protein n=1 Tax=Gayliella sp. TaxID=2575623 RepID=A0A4D6WYN9_9FLOR|nr:Molybdopterin biosynthesis protein [Gayliella sp.]
MLNTKTQMINLNKTEYRQYSKQLILGNIGTYGQKRLKTAKILIIGLGGLGCPIILYLTAAGIGNIGIVDHDVIDLSNLNRQILYNLNDLNKSKSIQASSFIKNINQECKITTYNHKLTETNVKQIIKLYDIIIDATDNFEARYLIDEICYKLHKTCIYGAINQYEGHVSVFNYKNNTRFIDIYPKNLALTDITCNENGILGSMSGIIGILQATEAIKVILGIGQLLNGVLLKYNLLNASFQKILLRPIKQTTSNQIIHHKPIISHEIIEINDISKINKNTYIILDIRNPIEFNLNHFDQAINIPLYYFQTQKIINFLTQYSKNYNLILICNNLTKSITLSNLLIKYQIKAYIMKKKL